MIASGRLYEFVTEFINLENDRLWCELYMHKVFDKSFEEFKSSFAVTQPKEDIETTVKDSKSILESFIPTGTGGEN